MSLRITLKADEKFTVNGIVMQNGDRKNVLSVISDDVIVMRERDVFTEEMANTPAKRIYYILQLMYMAGDFQAGSSYHKSYWELTKGFLEACPNPYILVLINEISELIMSDAIYKAWRTSKMLVEYEEEVMNYASHNDNGTSNE